MRQSGSGQGALVAGGTICNGFPLLRHSRRVRRDRTVASKFSLELVRRQRSNHYFVLAARRDSANRKDEGQASMTSIESVRRGAGAK